MRILSSRPLCVVAALGLLVAACGDDDDGASSTTASVTTGTTAEVNATTVPVDDEGCTAEREGGTVTMAVPSLGNSLDPLSSAAGSISGELVPIYDTLMRYDPASGSFEPQLAESLEPNADASVWTMELREGITFGNGKPLDAAAVKASVERHLDPANKSVLLATTAALVKSVAVVDDLTVAFTLAQPWGAFPIALTGGLGLVTDTSEITATGAEAFAKDPGGGGAGPYEVVRWSPPDSLELRAKEDWWGGPLCVSSLTFTAIPAATAAVDAFEQGEVDVELVDARDPRQSARAAELTDDKQTVIQHGGGIVLLNSGLPGSDPITKDVRVRQAIAAAIDVEAVNERAFDGAAVAQSGLIAEGSGAYEATEGPAYDPERAKELVAEVKAETGWDGSLRFDCVSNLADAAIAMEGMLEAVGFEVELNPNRTLPEQVQIVIVQRTYEAACFGHTQDEASFWAGLRLYDGRNPANYSGTNDPAMSAALDDLRTAVTQEEVQQGMEDVQEVWNEIVPAAVYAAFEHVLVWQEDVHGLYFNGSPTVTPYWDQAWVDG